MTGARPVWLQPRHAVAIEAAAILMRIANPLTAGDLDEVLAMVNAAPIDPAGVIWHALIAETATRDDVHAVLSALGYPGALGASLPDPEDTP